MSSTGRHDGSGNPAYVSDHEKDFISIDPHAVHSSNNATSAASTAKRDSSHGAQSSLSHILNAVSQFSSLTNLTGSSTPVTPNPAHSGASGGASASSPTTPRLPNHPPPRPPFRSAASGGAAGTHANGSNASNAASGSEGTSGGTTSGGSTTRKYPLEWRTIILIRHGNSIWNESTDNASLFRPVNTVKALGAFTRGVKEYATYKWKGDEYKHEDSMIVDTPLSPKGMRQAYLLSKFLASHMDLRQNQKLQYLEEHQSIASPIKDAWRLLQQCKMEALEEANGYNKEFPQMCSDALTYLTEAMRKLEVLMAHAPPVEPEYWNFRALEAQNEAYGALAAGASDGIGLNGIGKKIPSSHSRSKSMKNIIEPHNPHTTMDNNAQFDISSIMDLMAGKNIKSIVVTSNLRRAISTCVIGLWPRLRLSREKVYLLSCLQEVGVNVDTHTSTSSYSLPQVSKFEMTTSKLDSQSLNDFYKTRLSTIYNYGAKQINGFGIESTDETQKRLMLFAKWCFMTESGPGGDAHPSKTTESPDVTSDREPSASMPTPGASPDVSSVPTASMATASPGFGSIASGGKRISGAKQLIGKKISSLKKRKRNGSNKDDRDAGSTRNSMTDSPNPSGMAANGPIGANGGFGANGMEPNETGQIPSVGGTEDNGPSANLYRSESRYPDYNNYDPEAAHTVTGLGDIVENGDSPMSPNFVDSMGKLNYKIEEVNGSYHTDHGDSNDDNIEHDLNESLDGGAITKIDLNRNDKKKEKSGFLTNKKSGRNSRGRKGSGKNGNKGSGRRASKEEEVKHGPIPPVIIAVGHSKWFKMFFQRFLPSKMDYIGKEAKITNCGVVAFRFYYDRNTDSYGIAPKTLTTIYKGFGES